jgi:hypothetical protein
MWYVCLDLFGTLLRVYMYAWTSMCMYVVGVFVWMTCHVVMLCMSLNSTFSLPHAKNLLIANSHDTFLSRMASGTRGQAGGNPPPPPEPSMAQVLRLMLEDREAARAERQANLTTLQHLA